MRYLLKMQEHFDKVCEVQEKWIWWWYTEIAREKARGKELTYDDIKQKVQIRRGSYIRNQEVIREVIVELNRIIFINND